MKLVPALLVAAFLCTTASASDNYFYSSYQTAPIVGQTIGYSLHSDSCGCSTCAPSCAAPCDTCAPSCAAPCDTCAPSCAAPCDSCAPSCAAPCDACAPTCAAPCETYCDCCCPEPVCCPCEPEKKCLFDKIMDIERRKNRWLLGLIGH